MNQAHRSDQKNPEKLRALVVTEHAAQRYAQRCWHGGSSGPSLESRSAGEIMEAAIEADFRAARLVPKRERDALYAQQPRAIVKYGRAGATYFHNAESGTVFICEALSARAFRLVTCFRLDPAARPQRARPARPGRGRP